MKIYWLFFLYASDKCLDQNCSQWNSCSEDTKVHLWVIQYTTTSLFTQGGSVQGGKIISLCVCVCVTMKGGEVCLFAIDHTDFWVSVHVRDVQRALRSSRLSVIIFGLYSSISCGLWSVFRHRVCIFSKLFQKCCVTETGFFCSWTYSPQGRFCINSCARSSWE